MVLPTETISFSQINSELRRSPSAELDADDEELRVFAEELGSGPIDISKTRGKSIVGRTTGENVAVDAAAAVQFGPSTAGNRWRGNGILEMIVSDSDNFGAELSLDVSIVPATSHLPLSGRGRWTMIINSVLGSQYQIRATILNSFAESITFTGDEGSWSDNVWTTIGAGRELRTVATDFGSSATFRIEIRELSSSIIVGTSDITLTALTNISIGLQ